MLNALPDHTVAKRLRTYEHVDILWGKDVHKDVIPEVLNALEKYCEGPDTVNWKKLALNGADGTDGTDGSANE